MIQIPPNIKNIHQLNRYFREYNCRFSYKIPDNYKKESYVKPEFGLKMGLFNPYKGLYKLYITPQFFRRIRNPLLLIELNSMIIHEKCHRAQWNRKVSFVDDEKPYLESKKEIESFAAETAFKCRIFNITRKYLTNPKYYLMISRKIPQFNYYYQSFWKYNRNRKLFNEYLEWVINKLI